MKGMIEVLSICRQYAAGLILLCGITAAAQDELPAEQIEVVKDFEVRLADAEKINLNPRLPVTDTTDISYTYEVSTDVPRIEYIQPSLRPLALTPEAQAARFRGFARAGYGIPNFSLADLNYHIVAGNDLNIIVDAHHERAKDRDDPLQRYMQNYGRARATYALSESAQLGAGASYNLDEYFYYAEDPNDPSPAFDSRRYKLLGLNGGISNPVALKGGFHYGASVDFYNLQDDQGAKENGVDLDAYAKKVFNDKHPLAIDLDFRRSGLKDIQTQTLTIFSATPSFTWNHRFLSIRAGVALASDFEDFFFFPSAEASVRLIGDNLTIFAGADGGLNWNNFYTFSRLNPYISPRIDDLRNTSTYTYYAGAKGRISIFEFNGRISYMQSDDLALFLPDPDDARTFQPIFDDVDYFKAEGSVRFHVIDKLDLTFNIAKLFYDPANEDEAWHLPDFEVSAMAKYLLFDNRLRLRLSTGYMSGIHFIRNDRTTDTLKPIFDISAEAGWFFTQKIGVFIQGNNLTSTEAPRWQRYPSFGLNLVGGVMARF